MSLRLWYPAARHIVCVWNFRTDLQFDGSSYCEDGKTGVGAAILNHMVKNNITHRAIYIIRYCGEKLNADRIPIYIQAISAVIKQAPYNAILQCEQKIEEYEEKRKENHRFERKRVFQL